MLCAGIIHGDLSEYNVLVGADGPVIIDLPQAVDAAGNNNAAEHAASATSSTCATIFPLSRHRSRTPSMPRRFGDTMRAARSPLK